MELLKRLSEAYGPAGAEDQVYSIIKQELSGSDSSAKGFHFQIDALGNLLVTRQGTDPDSGTVVVSANMDELGLMVIDIDEKGFIRVGPVGSSKPSQWIGHRVIFSNQIIGVVGVEAVKDEKDITFSHLYIDLGIANPSSEIVQIGDVAAFYTPFLSIGENIWIGKALDNRVGCAALVKTLQSLPETKHTICAIFSAQHEVGTRGIKPAVFSLDPLFAITLGTTAAGDTPKAQRSSIHLGSGPAILVMEKNMIVAKPLREKIANLAAKHGFPYQWAITPGRLSDAGALTVSKSGIPTAGVSIPIRYQDTTSEMVYRVDFEQTVQLMIEILAADNLEFTNGI